MAIADLTTPTGAKKGPTCTVCQAIDGLDDTEAQALRSLLADPAWRYQELADRLADEGLRLQAFSLSRHARGHCSAGEKLRGVR